MIQDWLGFCINEVKINFNKSKGTQIYISEQMSCYSVNFVNQLSGIVLKCEFKLK